MVSWCLSECDVIATSTRIWAHFIFIWDMAFSSSPSHEHIFSIFITWCIYINPCKVCSKWMLKDMEKKLLWQEMSMFAPVVCLLISLCARVSWFIILSKLGFRYFFKSLKIYVFVAIVMKLKTSEQVTKTWKENKKYRERERERVRKF